jgi:hypothetical protein
MKMATKIFCIVGLLSLMACVQKPVKNNLETVRQDKFLKRIKIGDTEAIAKMQPGGKERNGNNEFVYFNIKFNKTGASTFNKEKILYLNFDMQKDFVLLKNRDSVAAVFCQRIENGIKNNFEYIIAFEKNSAFTEEPISLIYHDKIFSIGTVAFVYN